MQLNCVTVLLLSKKIAKFFKWLMRNYKISFIDGVYIIKKFRDFFFIKKRKVRINKKCLIYKEKNRTNKRNILKFFTSNVYLKKRIALPSVVI